jgi:hypothetical protein
LGFHVLLFYDRDVLSDLPRFDHLRQDPPGDSVARDFFVMFVTAIIGFGVNVILNVT